jgi:hypothetical protein
LELRRHLGLKSNFILIHPDQIGRCSGWNYLRENIRKELKKMNLSIDDLGNLRSAPDLLSGLQHHHQQEIDPSLRKAFQAYKGNKFKLPKRPQLCHKKVSNKNQKYADKRSVMRQELYGEVSHKELEMIVDTLMELESPNSLCSGDSKSE